ncbi:MAG: Uma2 family endonuclease [Pirellulaceae bacterium]|nr:Uma2 family endonuclease [Pirellulaceae bacterium]
MSSATRYVPNYSIADYRRWEGRWELIDGVAIAMTPSPFGHHERIVSRLSRVLGNQLDELPCECEVYTNLDWILGANTVIRPDLMVVCGEQPQRHLEQRPEIAVEVLSESTRESDTTVKRRLCLEHGVPHYLIIDPEARTIEHVTAQSSAVHYQDQPILISLQCDAKQPISIQGDRLFDERV